MDDRSKLDDYEHVCAVAAAGFGLFAECQRIDGLIRHHNLQTLIASVDGSKMFAFIKAVDKRGKAHNAAHPPAERGTAVERGE